MLRKRGKKGIVVALSFAALALTSVGFSTWIMGYQSTLDITNVTVEVANVERSSVIDASSVEVEDGVFRFDADKNDNTSPIVFSGDPETEGEDLEIKFSFNVNGSSDDVFNGLKLKATIDNETTSTYFNTYTGETPAETHYFSSPFKLGVELPLVYSNGVINNITETVNVGGTEVERNLMTISSTPDPNNEVTKYDVTINFTWGAYFNYENPSHIASDASSDTINNWLTALERLQALNSANIKLLVTHPDSNNPVT